MSETRVATSNSPAPMRGRGHVGDLQFAAAIILLHLFHSCAPFRLRPDEFACRLRSPPPARSDEAAASSPLDAHVGPPDGVLAGEVDRLARKPRPRRAARQSSRRRRSASATSTSGCSRKPMRAARGGPERRSTMRKRAAGLLEAAYMLMRPIAVVRPLDARAGRARRRVRARSTFGRRPQRKAPKNSAWSKPSNTQRVVRGGGARRAAAGPVDIFVDAGIDDEALAGEAQFEREDVAVRVRGQRVGADAAAIGDEIIAAFAPAEIAGVGIGEHRRRRRRLSEQLCVDRETLARAHRPSSGRHR